MTVESTRQFRSEAVDDMSRCPKCGGNHFRSNRCKDCGFGSSRQSFLSKPQKLDHHVDDVMSRERKRQQRVNWIFALYFVTVISVAAWFAVDIAQEEAQYLGESTR